MSYENIQVDIGRVDVSDLETDEDFRRKASALLPGALRKMGEALGEKTWVTMQKALRGPGIAVNRSPSAKRQFARESGENFRRTASAALRKNVTDQIVARLRVIKAGQA